MKRGILLYGPPAVGKDTITGHLERIGPFRQFRRLKCGPGRTTGYRMITPDELAQIQPADALYVNKRYGATYVVDRPGLEALWDAEQIPVVHLGQPEAIPLIASKTPETAWLVVDLHCPIRELNERIVARGTGDDEARLAAARATPRLSTPNLAIGTVAIRPGDAARLISESVSRTLV